MSVIRARVALGLLAGLALLSALLTWQGVTPVATRLAEAGWSLLLICLFALPEHLLNAEGWRRLFPRERRPRPGRTLLAIWMGGAVNSFLPVATIGGDVVKARVVALSGTPLRDAAATVLVDKTVQAGIIALWGLLGVAMLARLSDDRAAVLAVVSGVVLLGLGIATFAALQAFGGLGWLARFGGRMSSAPRWQGWVDAGEVLDGVVRDIYRRPWALLGSGALHLGARLVLLGEVLFAAWLMGHPIGFAEAVALKGIAAAVRGASFAVPAGLGLQEGSYVAVGALLGLPPDLMLGVSLATRAREFLPDVPFLFAWQHLEGRALLGRARGQVKARARVKG